MLPRQNEIRFQGNTIVISVTKFHFSLKRASRSKHLESLQTRVGCANVAVIVGKQIHTS